MRFSSCSALLLSAWWAPTPRRRVLRPLVLIRPARLASEELLSANQETLGQLKALGQALNNEKLSGAVAQAEGGCDQLAAQAAGSQQAGQANATLDKVKAAGDALKSLGSVFGNWVVRKTSPEQSGEVFFCR